MSPQPQKPRPKRTPQPGGSVAEHTAVWLLPVVALGVLLMVLLA